MRKSLTLNFYLTSCIIEEYFLNDSEYFKISITDQTCIHSLKSLFLHVSRMSKIEQTRQSIDPWLLQIQTTEEIITPFEKVEIEFRITNHYVALLIGTSLHNN